MPIEFNKVIITGHLASDPTLASDPAGHQVCNGTITNRRTWTGHDRQQHEEVNTFFWTAWGNPAEPMAKYLKKGSPVLLEGKLKIEQWRDKTTGEPRSKAVIIVTAYQSLTDEPAKD
jgi:single-strand DNA-binding protein